MDFGFFLLLALLWGVINLVGRAQQRTRQGGEGNLDRDKVVRHQRSRVPGKRPGTFDELLAEMRGQLEAARNAAEREARGLPPAEEIEERASLETVPVVVSRELPAPVTSRDVIDFDQGAEAIARRRVVEAEARNRAWQLSDHKAFDQRIRKRKVKVAAPTHPANMRQALIWSEVLGKPVSMREE